MNDIIREKHGLTYSVSLYNYDMSDKTYTAFSTDISNGDEKLLNDLLRECLAKTIETFDVDEYSKFMDIRKLKRKMNLLKCL